MRTWRTRPGQLSSESNHVESHNALSRKLTSPALASCWTACAASPAASSVTSTLVMAKRCLTGKAASPRYTPADAAAPSASPPADPKASATAPSAPCRTIPVKNSTTSLPSRMTASATTVASTATERDPSTTSCPSRRSRAVSSRACSAIHMTCQASITTARINTAAVNSSWPRPSNAEVICAAKAATTADPATPARIPSATARPRPGTPREAARTTPIIRPASSTSRKTMTSAASMAVLFDDEYTLCRLFVVLAEELVGALGKRLEADHGYTITRDNFLHFERLAFELLCARVQIFDGKLDRLSCWHSYFSGIELVVLDGDGDLDLVGAPNLCRCSQQGDNRDYAGRQCGHIRGRRRSVCHGFLPVCPATGIFLALEEPHAGDASRALPEPRFP